MNIRIKKDSVIIEGYVNAVERASKPLISRFGEFIEKICAGAFGRALKRSKDVRILLNHNSNRDLGGTATGELELTEDNIGLHARAVITDKEVIDDARANNLVGWSFGFQDRAVEILQDSETGLPLRLVKDLELFEVSILNREKTPAYSGTLVNVRDDKNILLGADNKPESIETIDDTDTPAEITAKEVIEEMQNELRAEGEPEAQAEASADESAEPVTTTGTKSIDYSEYKNIIAELKELRDSVK